MNKQNNVFPFGIEETRMNEINKLFKETFESRFVEANWSAYKYGRQVYLSVKFDIGFDELKRLENHNITVQKISRPYDEEFVLRITVQIEEDSF